jgi:hypothetical protein
MYRLVGILTLFVLLAPANTKPQTSMESDAAAFKDVPELTAGFRLLYEQKFPEGRDKFTEWTSQHPDDPFGYVAEAASYLFEEFYRQGVLTSDFFLDDNKFLKGIKGKPNPARMKNFLEATGRARELAKARLKNNPKDQEALFALTLAAGMESDADSILEKKQLDGLKRMKEANAHAKLLLAERSDAADAFVALGIANYTIGSLSAGFRALLWFGGVHGDKKLGMAQVAKTAENGRYLKPFAKIMLALAARREKQNALAQKLLRELSEEFPASPLFAAEYAKAMGRPIPAEMGP